MVLQPVYQYQLKGGYDPLVYWLQLKGCYNTLFTNANWKEDRTPGLLATTERMLQHPIYQFQLEGGYNPLVYQLQIKGGNNPLQAYFLP